MAPDKEEALDALAEAVRSSGLVDPGATVVVMASGGPDSACAAAGAARLLGPESVHVLHVNYRLRAEADRDEKTCRELCGRLRVDLHVERPPELQGNLQAAARRARYEAAERLRDRTGASVIVTGHTRTDLAETVLYRLVASPGARALRGMQPRSGRVIRPMLGLSRPDARELAIAAGLPFEDDPSNLDPAFARNRIRHEVLPVLAELGEAEANIAETHAELIEEAELLDALVLAELEGAGAPAGSTSIAAAELRELAPGLRRLALRALAERAAGRGVPLGREHAAEIARLAASPEGGDRRARGRPPGDLRGRPRALRAGEPAPTRRPSRPASPSRAFAGSVGGRSAPSSIPSRSSRPAPTWRRWMPAPWEASWR